MTEQLYYISASGSTEYVEPEPKKMILGGKGAGLHDMVAIGLPVPPAICIPTTYCNAFRKLGGKALRANFIDNLMGKLQPLLERMSKEIGYMPLVSVRSGAPFSMPGMMDTILNVGLTTMNVDEWGTRIGERAAFDSYRRLIQMLGSPAFGVPNDVFEHELKEVKKLQGVTEDTELDVAALKTCCFMMTQKFQAVAQQEFPNTFEEQLRAAVAAVFNSWMNPRAIEYRKMNKISEDLGTAVNVQCMAFGNMGDDSGTGVLFTRNPSTGATGMMGEFLPNAQGEDVVAGIRTPINVAEMEDQPQPHRELWQVIHAELLELCETLEKHYRDMVDIEFTVMQGKLFVLQSRVGKRSAKAAFQIAHDLVEEGVITPAEAIKRITREQFKLARRPMIDPKWKAEPRFTGLPACPGIAVGVPVFSSADAVNCTEPCVLVTHETTPDDIAGMNAARGILTQTGGATSHAAVVARAMDKPCVVGCTELNWDLLKKAKTVAIDGATGRVWLNEEVPVVDSSQDPSVHKVMSWCVDEMGVVPLEELEREEAGGYAISALTFWGNEDVMEVVLETLAEKEDRHLITLDVRGPKDHMPLEDQQLHDAFYIHDEVKFYGIIRAALDAHAAELKGLNIRNAPSQWVSQLKKLGYTVAGTAQTVADLMEGGPVNTTPEFIEKVIGGPEAWKQLEAMLLAAGVKFHAVPEAVPAEYAAYKMLAAQ